MRKLLIFLEIQDGGRRHLGFSKVSIFLNFCLCIVFLGIVVKFGEDQNTQSKVAWIIRNFNFGLNFPFEGLFGEVFGGKRPPNGVKYNSNPQKALPSAE